MDILPAIDLRNGKCVRLLQGDYNKQIDYADDPVAVAKEFESAGAKWLHVVDLDGAKEGKPHNLPTIERLINETKLKVEVGGGLRTVEAIESLIATGAARCVVGTRALEDWAWFKDLVHRPACKDKIALGLDARESKLATHGWTRAVGDTALQLAERVGDWPLGAIIYTDIGRDGMLLGPNVEATGDLAMHSRVPVIASGGVTDISDVERLRHLPIAGMIIGRALYEKQLDLAEAVRLVQT